MANTIKPNDFPQSSLPLTGEEEVYTQTNGVNGKFTVNDIWTGNTVNYSETPILTGRKWIDGKDEYEVVLRVSGFVDGSAVTHDLGIETYISIEAFTWKSTDPDEFFAMNRQESGALTRYYYESMRKNDIGKVFTGGFDELQFLIRFTKL